jgi:hypothetical protein
MKVMNATGTFALLRSPGSIFRPQILRGNGPPGARTTLPDRNNDRARCLVRPVPPQQAQQRRPGGLSPHGEGFLPVPDFDLPSHSTGAKP